MLKNVYSLDNDYPIPLEDKIADQLIGVRTACGRSIRVILLQSLQPALDFSRRW